MPSSMFNRLQSSVWKVMDGELNPNRNIRFYNNCLSSSKEKETIINVSVIFVKKKGVWENALNSNFYSFIFIWTIFY